MATEPLRLSWPLFGRAARFALVPAVSCTRLRNSGCVSLYIGDLSKVHAAMCWCMFLYWLKPAPAFKGKALEKGFRASVADQGIGAVTVH